MKDKDKQILEHIYDYCRQIEKTICRFGDSFSVFEGDWDYKSSVSFNIQQIGELAKRLSEEFIEETRTEIPWKEIKGIRDLFAHQYSSMNVEEIWNTAKNDIPQLARFCQKQLDNINH